MGVAQEGMEVQEEAAVNPTFSYLPPRRTHFAQELA